MFFSVFIFFIILRATKKKNCHCLALFSIHLCSSCLINRIYCVREGFSGLFCLKFICFCFAFSSISDPFIFNLCHKDHVVGDQRCSRYSYCDIKEIRLMRFLLQVGTNMPSCLSESCCSSNII